MRQISTAPPGVTALPAAAMRTGHMTFAFLTPSASASFTITSMMASSFQSGRASKAGMTFSSTSLEDSLSDLDFLWTKSSAS